MKRLKFSLLFAGILGTSLFLTNCSKNTSQSDDNLLCGTVKPLSLIVNCNDASAQASEISIHEISLNTFNQMISDYCSSHNIQFSGYRIFTLQNIQQKINNADCNTDVVALWADDMNNNATIRLEIIKESDIPNYLYPNTNVKSLTTYSIALFKGIINKYNNIENFQFAYGNLNSKETVIFGVKGINLNGFLAVYDFGNDFP